MTERCRCCDRDAYDGACSECVHNEFAVGRANHFLERNNFTAKWEDPYAKERAYYTTKRERELQKRKAYRPSR